MIPLPNNLRSLRAAWRVTAEVDERATPCFRISNADTSAKILVYDVIGGYDLDASDFVRELHALDVKSIDLHVNSPGGFVYDGVAMYEALKAHPATVSVHVDGLAASAASFLAQAADPYNAKADTGGVRVAKAGRMMIHDAQGIGIGSPADMREYADLLDSVSNDIAGIYADRAGGKPEAWRGAMQATTWYSAAQAVDAGLADRVTGGSGPDNRTRLIQARQRALATQGG
jgi:ATP-dependent protease ClpP protease subunit